MTDDFKVID